MYRSRSIRINRLRDDILWGKIDCFMNAVFLLFFPFLVGVLCLFNSVLGTLFFIFGELGWLSVLCSFSENFNKVKVLKEELRGLEDEV